MILSDKETARLRKLLLDVEKGLLKKTYKPFVSHRLSQIRLILNKAERREKNRLL
jgi:hypothetical protein